MSVSCECCVFSGRGLCDELITRPEESNRLWFVVVYDLNSSKTGQPWPSLGRSATKKIFRKNADYLLRGNNRSRMYSYWRSKSGLYPVPVCARFVAGKMALGQALLGVNLVVIPPVLHAHLHLPASLRWTRRRNLKAF